MHILCTRLNLFKSFQLTMDGVSLILCTFLMGGMCFNILLVTAMRFKVRRFYGAFTVTYYIVFLVVAILTETGVLLNGWVQEKTPNY